MAADNRLSELDTPETLDEMLAQDLQRQPYFTQLILVNSEGEPLAINLWMNRWMNR
jgi:hypothetical protein